MCDIEIRLDINSGGQTKPKDVFQYWVDDGRGNPGYKVPIVDTSADPQVKWTCVVRDNGVMVTYDTPFTILFDNASPCLQGRLQSPAGAAIVEGFLKNHPTGRFRYVVAVATQQGIYADDPDIITWR